MNNWFHICYYAAGLSIIIPLTTKLHPHISPCWQRARVPSSITNGGMAVDLMTNAGTTIYLITYGGTTVDHIPNCVMTIIDRITNSGTTGDHIPNCGMTIDHNYSKCWHDD